jgi:hypothetical protein
MKIEVETVNIRQVIAIHPSSLRPHPFQIGQTPDLPATHVAVATVAPFPAWRGSQGERCAEPEV